MTQVNVGYGPLNVAYCVSCKVLFILSCLVYMVDGSVLVKFIPKQVNTFVLLELNCKIYSLGGAKSPYFVHK